MASDFHSALVRLVNGRFQLIPRYVDVCLERGDSTVGPEIHGLPGVIRPGQVEEAPRTVKIRAGYVDVRPRYLAGINLLLQIQILVSRDASRRSIEELYSRRSIPVQPSRPAPSLQPLTILCVDDEAVALSIRKSLLERAGYYVLPALDADQAFQIFRLNRIDIVVSDHLLPGATGIEMACTMKLAKPEVPILLLTGIVDPPPGTEHVDKFINKAEGPDKLLQDLSRHSSIVFVRHQTEVLVQSDTGHGDAVVPFK